MTRLGGAGVTQPGPVPSSVRLEVCINGERLNIGAGATGLAGFTPIDRKLGVEAYPLKYADNSVEEIRASHILEHFSFAEVPKVLADWVQKLKPGGRMRVAVPNLDWIADNRADPKSIFYLMGGQTDDDDFHKSAFTPQSLERALSQAGLVNIQAWKSDNTDSAHLPCSLNLEGVKATGAQADAVDIKITALLSMPRVGWNDHWGCAFDALRPFRIPVRWHMGAFWGQCLQNLLEDCVAEGLDWVLTLDYDTMFSPQHLDKLLGHFGQNPEIDALAALQCRRCNDTPLMTIEGQTSAQVGGAPLKVSTAHFGMTLIRLDALKDVPKPWFCGKPGPDGSWQHPERLDPDIWFWHQWRLAKKTVYVAPDVRVGHLEVMVAEFDDEMKAQHRYVKDWRGEHCAAKERLA